MRDNTLSANAISQKITMKIVLLLLFIKMSIVSFTISCKEYTLLVISLRPLALMNNKGQGSVFGGGIVTAIIGFFIALVVADVS